MTMLKTFVYAWISYWLIVALLPVESIYPSTIEAFSLQLAFVGLVAIGYMTILNLWGSRPLPSSDHFEIPASAALIRIAILLSLVGLAALVYDKIYVQGIDYTQGLAVARQEWRELGEEREGHASSVFSVVGYLCGSAYFVATVLAITQTRLISPRERLWTLLVSFALVLANSVLTGGRSSILLFATFVVSAIIARKGLSLRRLISSRRQRQLLKALTIGAPVYVVYIFYARADANGKSALDYAIDFLPFLGLEAQEWYRQTLNGSFLSSVSAMCVLALSYLTHSFAIMAAIVDAPTEDKQIMFLEAADILYKVGLTPQPDFDWFMSGRFPSVPGALWHEFGWSGLFFGSVSLGAACGGCTVWTTLHPNRLLPLGAYVMAGSTLLLSPAFFAADSLSFPFVFGSFVMLALAGRFIHRPRYARPPAGPASHSNNAAAV